MLYLLKPKFVRLHTFRNAYGANYKHFVYLLENKYPNCGFMQPTRDQFSFSFRPRAVRAVSDLVKPSMAQLPCIDDKLSMFTQLKEYDFAQLRHSQIEAIES